LEFAGLDDAAVAERVLVLELAGDEVGEDLQLDRRGWNHRRLVEVPLRGEACDRDGQATGGGDFLAGLGGVGGG